MMRPKMNRLLVTTAALAGFALCLVAVAPQALAEPTQLTSTGGAHPAASPDGNWVAFAVPGGGIARISAAGGAPELLCASGGEPDWGRAGSLIVFRDGEELFTIDAETQEIQPIRQGGFDDDPAWSPAGDEIAAQGTSTSIALIAYPGGQVTTIPCTDPDGSGCEGEGPTWSPNAAQLAFEDGLDLLKVARNGGTAELIYHCEWDLAQPAWSPAGRWIAITRGDAASWENSHIWIVDQAGDAFGLVQQTMGDAEDYHPAWSPDGSRIYFQSNRSGSTEIWVVDAQETTATAASTWSQVKSFYRD